MNQSRREVLARPGLADERLRGEVEAERYTPVSPQRCAVAVTAVRSAPGAPGLEDQLLFGETFEVLEVVQVAGVDWAFGRAARDGYVGHVAAADLAPPRPAPDRWVSALRVIAFAEPNLTSRPIMQLSMNALVRAGRTEGRFTQTDAGWIGTRALSALEAPATDMAGAALAYLGAPYQWGGRDSLGLDCSGLVQQALYACGRSCPRDSDQQLEAFTSGVAPGDLRRGDLMFWPGHVAVLIDPETVVHANGHHMAVVVEPLAEAVARNRAAGYEPIGFRRP